MQADLLNLFLGFLEGVALIVSPCILPILPIILAGSLSGSKRRPIGIVIGFIVIFALFTFFSRQLVIYSGIDLNLVRQVSYGILLLFGIIMLSSYLSEKFTQFTQCLTTVGANLDDANNPQGGLFSGILFGGLVALIWTPCAGPILAAVIVQTVIQKSSLMSFLTLVAFGLGAAIPMLLIAAFGRLILDKLSFLRSHTTWLRKTLGALIVLSVCYMLYQETTLNAAPLQETKVASSDNLQNGLTNPYKAPVIGGITEWINSPPLQLSELQNKVILIDFWAYSCINCVRTIPYLNSWYKKYHDKGLVIIGVHTPEFEFEKNLDNIKSAVIKDQIKYPVALDNQFVTWLNFHNSYWPAHYLIDKQGNVVYTHFGEGDYGITENNIRYLLGIKEQSILEQEPAKQQKTPETYLGYARAAHFASPEAVTKDVSAQYSFPNELPQDAWGLQGSWKIMPDKIISDQKSAKIKIHFTAKKVYIVMGNASKADAHVELLLNGKAIFLEKGKDVVDSGINVNKHTLYEALALDATQSGILEVITSAPGLEFYTFTFG